MNDRGYPIPPDWDGEAWRCIEIQWPNSPWWIAILRGLLSSMGRGRTWDRDTGSIKGVQKIGDEIFAKNWLLPECQVCQGEDNGNESSGGAGAVGGAGASYSDEWMLMMIGAIIDVKCQDGYLQVRRFPCCEWEIICAIPGGTPDDYDPWEGNDPPITYSACGKADALVNALWLVLDAGWDAQGGLPWSWVGEVEAALPGYDLSNTEIISLVTQSIDLDNDYSKAEVLTDYRKQQLRCLAAAIFSDTAGGMTGAQYEQWRGLSSVVFTGEQRQWARTGMQAIGENNSSMIAALGAANTGADCACPGSTGPTDPTENGWYLSAPAADLVIESTGSSGWTPTCRVHEPVHDVFGAVFEVVHAAGAADLKKMSAGSTCGGETGDTLWGDTSGNSTSHPRVGTADSDVLDELFGVDNYALSSGGMSWSDNPASPDHLAETVVIEAWQLGNNIVDSATIRNFRFIHNTNSPSHS